MQEGEKHCYSDIRTSEIEKKLVLINVTRSEKIDHLQELLNSRYRLTKSGYGK